MIEQERPAGRSASTDGACAECTAIIATHGVRHAIEFLNARTRFRFTGVFRLDPPHLSNLFLFDRENPDMNCSGEVTPLEDTYCALACENGSFETGDSMADARLAHHSARSTVISYAGVPIRLSDGQVWGTLCHYDVRPRLLPQGERLVLESMGPLLVESMQRDDTLAGAFIAPSSTAPRDSVAPQT